MKPAVGAVAALLLLVSGVAPAEQFYKWKDENGVWHYSTTPPKDKASTEITVHGSGGRTRQADAPTAAPTSPTAAPTGAAAPRNQAAANANCERARANVATLENYSRVTLDRDGDGQEEELSQEEQIEQLRQARQQVDVYCGGG